MITTEPTAAQIRKWQQIFEKKAASLSANRKTGAEVDKYFRERYAPEIYHNTLFAEAVEFNAMSEYNAEKLKNGETLNIVTYKVNDCDVLVGIDLTTGFFHIESENIDRAEEMYDDLFVFRGLDEFDLKNFVLVAQYILLKG